MIPDIVNELRKHVQGEVRFDQYSRTLYSTDASIYELQPMGVVIPKSVEDIQATVELADKHRIPITPRGGGTSLAGNAIGKGIILDCSKYLNRILEVNSEENWARIQPGVILDQLNGQLKPHELLFAPDVATSNRANIGGMIGNNSSGAHSIVYGKTVDHVLELHVLLANGQQESLGALSQAEWDSSVGKDSFLSTIYAKLDEIIRAHRDEIHKKFPKILRRVAGYNLDEFVRRDHNNLAKLIVGSEGTLAVVTEAKVRLKPLKKHSGLAVVHFQDVSKALEAVGPILEFQPWAVELIDDNIINGTRSTLEYARRLTFVDGFPGALQIIEFQSDSKQEIIDQVDKLAASLAKKKIGYHCYKAIEQEQQDDVWYIRKAGLGLLMGTRENRKPIGFIEDSAVPVNRLPEYISRFDEIVRGFGTEASYYAHASVGCLHIRPKIDVKDAQDVKAMGEMAHAIGDLALEFGGTISGEHGDGLSRSCWNEKMFGPQLYQALREVKQVFDPKNILNPGKIVDAQFMTENLRKFPKLQEEPITPFFDYSKEGGLLTAIEICNGNGVCRKLDSGTMCPSYMVTREEEHSTRGRANALRAIITGKLDVKEFTSRRMYEVMDLCLGCKGCK
ncbi:FAD-binding oxidoreductase, partial [bacterium]|nr:FAD-binding oxidoreductase [bacterium]